MQALISGVNGLDYQMAPAAAPSPTRPSSPDAVSQLLDLSVPGLNFLQRFTAACWQMEKSWLETEGEKPGSDPWPTMPLERIVISQRFYSAGIKSYLAQDWTSASENLGSALHLQLYPYFGSGMEIRAWHHHIASTDVNAVAMRNWIGRLLIMYGKTQLGWAKQIKDIHAADMCYLSADAAVGILHGIPKGNTLEKPFSEEGIRILFPGDSVEALANVDDALRLRNECATTLVDIARQGDAMSMYYALLPRGVTFNPVRNPGDLLQQLKSVLHTPITAFSELCGATSGRGISSIIRKTEEDDGSKDQENDGEEGEEDVIVTITVEKDEPRMKKEAKTLMKMKPMKALHAAAIVAAHGNRDWFRKEVGIDCWDDIMNTPDMRKCREAVEMLWTTNWKKEASSEVDPTPISLMESMHLVQYATWQSNQILYGTSVGMRHATQDIILSNDGFRWIFMDYFYKERLQDGNGEETAQRVISQTMHSRPEGTIPNSLPVPCIDFSLLQNSLLMLNEVALRDLVIALKALERAQASVGGPEAFWPLIQINNGAAFFKNINNDASIPQALSPEEFHNIVGAIIEATRLHKNPLNNNNNAALQSSSSSRKTTAGTLLDDDKEPWERGALSMFGEGLGIPAVKPISLHQRGVKALLGLIFISFDDAVIVLVLLLCLICAVSLYRALFHMFGWGIWWNKALSRSGSSRHSGGGGGGRSIPSHSAWVIAQRNAAATGLREAIASEAIPRLAAAVKAAEEAGVEKPLVKKGKERLQQLKKRKISATGNSGNGGNISPSLAAVSNGSSSSTLSGPASRPNSSAGLAAMRLLTKHTPANSGDEAADWANGNDDEWVVVSPKSQNHQSHSQNQQQQKAQDQFSPSPVAIVSPTAVVANEKKEAAATPGTPVRQPLPPSASQFASEESQRLLSQQGPQQPSTPTASSATQAQPAKFISPAGEDLGVSSRSGSASKLTPTAKNAPATTTTTRMQQHHHVASSVQPRSSSPSSISSLSTSTSEASSSHTELRQTTSLPPSRAPGGRSSNNIAGAAGSPAAVAAVGSQPVQRCSSAPSRGSGKMKGVETEKPEKKMVSVPVQSKPSPKVVLVKRSSLQQRPSPSATAAGAGNKKPHIIDASSLVAVSRASQSPSTTTTTAFGATAGATTSSRGNNAMATCNTSAATQLPVLSFGTSFGHSPSGGNISGIHAGGLEYHGYYGSAPQLLSAGQGSGPGSGALAATAAAENEDKGRGNTTSLLLGQASSQAAWSPSAPYAAGNNKFSNSSSTYDEIGYTDAWATIGKHFRTTAPPISPSFSAAGFGGLGAHSFPSASAGADAGANPSPGGALSPSGPFDARIPTVLSTETSLGLSLLPSDSSLSGLSGRTTSLPKELLASLQQIWEGPPSGEGSLTPSYSSNNTTPQTTPVSQQQKWSPASTSAASPLGDLLPSAGLTKLASQSSAEQAHWLGNRNSSFLSAGTHTSSVPNENEDDEILRTNSSSFRGNHRAHSGSLADLGFEESSEF